MAVWWDGRAYESCYVEMFVLTMAYCFIQSRINKIVVLCSFLAASLLSFQIINGCISSLACPKGFL